MKWVGSGKLVVVNQVQVLEDHGRRDNIQRDWIGLCSVLRPHQHSIGYMGDGFYRLKDPTNSIKVLKENLQKKINQRTKKTQNTQAYTQNGKTNTAYNYNTASLLVYNNMG